MNGLLLTTVALNSDTGQRLIDTVAARFQTSKDAARVRLLKKQLLADSGLARVGELFQGKNLQMANWQIALSAVVFELLIPLPECATFDVEVKPRSFFGDERPAEWQSWLQRGLLLALWE